MRITLPRLAAAAAVVLLAGAGPVASAASQPAAAPQPATAPQPAAAPRSTIPRSTAPAAGTTASTPPTARATGVAPVQLPVATGDPRHPRRPRIPGVCARLNAGLATSTGTFSRADEVTPPDTGRLQAALDRCAGTGRAVELTAGPADDAFLSGPLTIGRHEVLLIRAGVTLDASLNPADYQIPSQYPANTCGTISAGGGGCRPFITFAGPGSGLMGTRAPDGRLGAVDGRGNGTLAGSGQTWWDLAAVAASGGHQNNPVLVEGDGTDDLTIYQVELENSPMYHVEVENGSGLTVWDVQIDTPATARNTDGIDPVSESDVTIRDDMVQDGDDCVAVKANAGTPSRDITVDGAHCYGSHGLSIGSQTAGGVTNVLFEHSTLDGYDSLGNLSADATGVQIKTDAVAGGLTQRVTYRDICLTSVKHLLIFNPHYASGGTSLPTQRDIVVSGVVATHSVPGAYSVFEGYDAAHPLQIDLENIGLDSTTQDGSKDGSPTQYVDAGTYDTDIVPAGPLGDAADGVTVTPIDGHGTLPACQFPAFAGGPGT